MRLALQPDSIGGRSLVLRAWGRRSGEFAYIVFGIRGLRAEIEFPSDWHEHRRAWVRLGFGLFSINFSFPWRKVVPDHYQCSGPTYGFYFFGPSLVLCYGKTKGTRGDPIKHIDMPWAWRHREHKVLSGPEQHGYAYRRNNGELQIRTATIQVESRLWTRPWIPWKRLDRSIDVKFDDEVGERTGSWKGGTIGCGYTMRKGERPVDTLRRMERERRF